MHILQNANEYGPMETTMTLLHSAQKKRTNEHLGKLLYLILSP